VQAPNLGYYAEENRENFAEFTGGAVEVVEEFFAVDALDAVEVLDGEFGFVGLEVTDEFPAQGGGGGGGLGTFLDGLLDAVFADGTEAVTGGEIGGGGGGRFRHGEEFDVARIAAGGSAGGGDFGAKGVGAAGKLGVINAHKMAGDAEGGGLIVVRQSNY